MLDWAQARDVAEKSIADAVRLFNLVRIFPAERSEELVRRAVAALRPGGTAVVVDHHPQPRGSRFQRAVAGVIALELFNATPGRLHDPDDVARWLVAAGCSRPSRSSLRRSPGSCLLTGRKKLAQISSEV